MYYQYVKIHLTAGKYPILLKFCENIWESKLHARARARRAAPEEENMRKRILGPAKCVCVGVRACGRHC